MSCLPSCENGGKQLEHPSGSGVGRSTNAALDNLRDELGDEAVERFLNNYLALLDQRVLEVGQSIRQGRQEECITLLLTLETSSHMVGADDLSLLATALRLALGHHQADTESLLANLESAGVRTREMFSRN